MLRGFICMSKERYGRLYLPGAYERGGSNDRTKVVNWNTRARDSLASETHTQVRFSLPPRPPPGSPSPRIAGYESTCENTKIRAPGRINAPDFQRREVRRPFRDWIMSSVAGKIEENRSSSRDYATTITIAVATILMEPRK